MLIYLLKAFGRKLGEVGMDHTFEEVKKTIVNFIVETVVFD